MSKEFKAGWHDSKRIQCLCALICVLIPLSASAIPTKPSSRISARVDSGYGAINQNITNHTVAGNSTIFAYDDANRLTSITSPDSVCREFYYNECNQVVTNRIGNSANWHEMVYAYNSDGLCTGICGICVNGSVPYELVYDAEGRLTSVKTNGISVYALEYGGNQGNGGSKFLTGIADSLDALGGAQSVAYIPDASGYGWTRTLPEGVVLTQEVNDVSTVTRSTLQIGSDVYPVTFTLADHVHPSFVDRRGSVPDTYLEYNACKECMVSTNSNGSGITLMRNADTGNITNRNLTHLDRTEYFAYNGAGWLTNESCSGRIISYTYRLDGVRETYTLNGTTTYFVCSDAGVVQMISNATQVCETNVVNDQGRISQRIITGGSTYNYEYNAVGQLTNFTDSLATSNSATYNFDCFARRVKMTVGGTNVTRMVYQGDDVVAEYISHDGGSTVARKRVYWLLPEIDQKIGFVDITSTATNLYYYLCDIQGTVHQIVDSSGNVVNQYDYRNAFGNVDWNSTNTFEGVENRYLWQGREYDRNSGTYYFRNRTYIPEWGSFTGPDMNLSRGIEGEEFGVGSYIFCGNDPIGKVDPYGLWAGVDDAIASGAGLAVGLAVQAGVDSYNSWRAKSWQFGGWREYTAAGVSGAAGGEAFLYTGPVGSGAAAGAAANLARQTLNVFSDKQQDFSFTSYAGETAFGAVLGKGFSVASSYISKGYQAVRKPISDAAKSLLQGTGQRSAADAVETGGSLLKHGEVDLFGTLDDRALVGDRLTPHEIPSRAAMEEAFLQEHKLAALSGAQRRALQRQNVSVMLDEDLHSLLDTTGGKNTLEQILLDADDLTAAQRLDLRDLSRKGLCINPRTGKPYLNRDELATIIRRMRAMNKIRGVR